MVSSLADSLPQPSSDEELDLIADALAIDPADVSDTDVEEMRDLVQRAMFAVAEHADSIRAQIARVEETRTRYEDGGDWWRRAHSALRHKARQRQQLQLVFGRLNRRARTQRGDSDERLFVNMAKLHLPQKTFDAIWQLVHTHREPKS